MTRSANAVVWAEIPVRDLAAGRAFYGSVLDCDLKDVQMGPNMAAVFPYAEGEGVSGHLYPGTPAPEGQGPTVSLLVPDRLEDAMTRLVDAGGRLLGEPIRIPAGRFVYAVDPDGNSLSLFER